MSEKNIAELVFITDVSGSMQPLQEDTIGGFNSVLEEYKSFGDNVRVTTVLFNQDVKELYLRVPISEVIPLDEENYCPGGTTALNDALGKTLNKIMSLQLSDSEGNKSQKTLVVVATDGQENSSREYTLSAVSKMIETLQSNNGWEFLFQIQNLDVKTVAENYCLSMDDVELFEHSSAGERHSHASRSMRLMNFLY